MSELIFKVNTNEDYREATEIKLTVPDDMDIWEYKVVCARLAAAIGYPGASIRRCFGSNRPSYENATGNILELENILRSGSVSS